MQDSDLILNFDMLFIQGQMKPYILKSFILLYDIQTWINMGPYSHEHYAHLLVYMHGSQSVLLAVCGLEMLSVIMCFTVLIKY